MKTHFLTFSLLVLFHCTTITSTLAQSPAPAPPLALAPAPPLALAPAPPLALAPTPPLALAPAPPLALAPSGPTDITKILGKAGKFTTLIRLLKTTQVGDRMNTQLSNSNQGLTILAPTDDAFSSLKPGTLNSLTDEQQTELVLFHVLPSFFPTSQFQAVSNPLRTQAGDSSSGQFPLNVTTSGNQVNVSTGIVDATVTNAIYSDNQLAVYQVDKVLLPWAIFGPHVPAPAPDLSKKPKKKSVPAPSSVADASLVSSGAIGLGMHGLLVGFIAVVMAVICNN